MSTSLSSPVTGATQAGFTSPTYTVTVDQAPDVNAKQWYVSALGGTQDYVRTHAAADPFTIAFWRDKVTKILSAPLANGRYSSVPTNKYKCITRKGVRIADEGEHPSIPMIIRTEIEVPANAESKDHVNVKAALSAHIGALTQVSSGLGDTTYTGTL